MSEVKRDPRYNSSDGKAREAPNVKESGAATVARVMTRAERPQPTESGGPIRFTIEEGNRAKRIDHDAAPK